MDAPALSTRVLLLGEAPSRRSDPERPFSGASGLRLARLAGLERIEDGFDVANLVDVWPGAASKGTYWDYAAAAAAAQALRAEGVLDGRRVVFVGRRVAAAFGARSWPYLEWRGDVAVFPHPSGVNRWWNDPRHVRRAKRFLRELASS